MVVDFINDPTAGRRPPMEMCLAPKVVFAELEGADFSAEVVEETLPRHSIIFGTRGARAGSALEPLHDISDDRTIRA